MSRFADGAVIVSQPIHTFPNGDYFFVEVCRTNGRYRCEMMLARKNSDRTVPVVHVLARTVEDAQQRCYESAVEKCPRLPRPPYLKRGLDTVHRRAT
jgi:hypothetical protein